MSKCELKIKSCLFLTKSFADQLWFSEVQLIFDQNVFTAEDLSCYEYTQFIALYVATAAFNLLFKLRYSLKIENKWTKFKDLPFLVQSALKISPDPP